MKNSSSLFQHLLLKYSGGSHPMTGLNAEKNPHGRRLTGFRIAVSSERFQLHYPLIISFLKISNNNRQAARRTPGRLLLPIKPALPGPNYAWIDSRY
jgi:hypothetical protein